MKLSRLEWSVVIMVVEVGFLLLYVGLLYVLYYYIVAIMKENEDYAGRIRELSYTLQIAEYQSGRPYYTSLCHNQLSIETPKWLCQEIRRTYI